MVDLPVPLFGFASAEEITRCIGALSRRSPLDNEIVVLWPNLPLLNGPTSARGIPSEILATTRFRWCGVGSPDPKTPSGHLTVPGAPPRTPRAYVVAIELTSTEQVYVIDQGAMIGKSHPSARRAARAQSVVTLTEYSDNYTQPVVLVGRPLTIAEVRPISGPWPIIESVQWLLPRYPAVHPLLQRAVESLSAFQQDLSAWRAEACRQSIGELRTFLEGIDDFHIIMVATVGPYVDQSEAVNAFIEDALPQLAQAYRLGTFSVS